MEKLFNDADLSQLALQSRDSFGPGSALPFIAIDLSHTTNTHNSWIADLPCPVIGIGEGPLSQSCDVILNGPKKLATICQNILNAPTAAMILVQHLRMAESLPVKKSLTAESFAYAAVQNGPDFKRWLEGYNCPEAAIIERPPLSTHMENDQLTITLTRPETQNAIDIETRDALCEALDLAITDQSLSRVSLKSCGKTFSSGGYIREFGLTTDPATAHWVRSIRLPAWRLARLGKRLHVHVNGAAIGAGAEIAAFGHHVTASQKAWFQLPELKYGLIPGAGGTASLPRRIGRQKTAYMALSMARIRARTALKWGLIDEIV